MNAKQTRYRITIGKYYTWLDNLNFIAEALGFPNKARLNGKNEAILELNITNIILELKKKVVALNLPVLERKWSIINENHRIQ